MLTQRPHKNLRPGEITGERFEEIAMSRVSHYIRLQYLSERTIEHAEETGRATHTREYRASNENGKEEG
jgi:hypothetical protein